MSAVAGIGIDGLPAPLGQVLPGHLYALSAPDQALATALTVGATGAALAARRRIALVVSDPESTCAALSAAGLDPVRAHRRGSLRVFGWTPRSSRAARLGPAQLLDELDAFGCGENALVWLWPAHPAFRWDDGAALAGFARLYQAWARLCRTSMVLLFGGQGSGEGHAQQLVARHPALGGLALLHGDARDALWETRQWSGTDPRQTAGLLQLGLGSDGRLRCEPDLVAEAENWRRRMLAADDRHDVLITRTAAGDTPSPSWTVLDDDATVERQMAGAVAASAVFGIASGRELRALARRLHRLRIACGRGVRLLVCEQGFRLRHGQVRLLLSLGAHAIVTPPQRVEAVLTQLDGIPYARPLSDDFEAALRTAIPPPLGGFREPVAFAVQARAMALQARDAGLECVLVGLSLAPSTDAAHARAQCRPTRTGDLFSIDGDTLHLLLYGCWLGDVDAALGHILQAPVEQLFDGQLRLADTPSILAALERIAARAATATHRPAVRAEPGMRSLLQSPLALQESAR